VLNQQFREQISFHDADGFCSGTAAALSETTYSDVVAVIRYTATQRPCTIIDAQMIGAQLTGVHRFTSKRGRWANHSLRSQLRTTMRRKRLHFTRVPDV
jgi:hypothetical protein